MHATCSIPFRCQVMSFNLDRSVFQRLLWLLNRKHNRNLCRQLDKQKMHKGCQNIISCSSLSAGGVNISEPLWLIEWTIATRCCMTRPLQLILRLQNGIECRHSCGRWYRQIRAHYAGASWHSSLAASHCADVVQDCCFDLRLCPRYWFLSTSSKSSVQSRTCNVGHSVQLASATCLFRGQTRPSASEVSPSRLQSSGTHFHLISAHRTTVADSSDPSWKRIFFRQAYNTAWFLWEQFVEECNIVTCN